MFKPSAARTIPHQGYLELERPIETAVQACAYQTPDNLPAGPH